MIDVHALHKRFGKVIAVDGVSFQAPDGGITGLLGENGAGKTTTLGMICGAVRPDAGAIAVDGVPLSSRPHDVRRRIGALLDHNGLYPRLTARENITYFGELHGMPPDALDARVNELLTLLGLERLADRRAAGFSQGERMKVALGRAMVHSPGTLLLDEPTNGLDVSSVRALRDLLRRMRDRGLCIVFSSHVLEEVRLLCDTLVIMAAGRIVARGRPEDVCREAGCGSLEEAFVQLIDPREAQPCLSIR